MGLQIVGGEMCCDRFCPHFSRSCSDEELESTIWSETCDEDDYNCNAPARLIAAGTAFASIDGGDAGFCLPVRCHSCPRARRIQTEPGRLIGCFWAHRAHQGHLGVVSEYYCCYCYGWRSVCCGCRGVSPCSSCSVWC